MLLLFVLLLLVEEEVADWRVVVEAERLVDTRVRLLLDGAAVVALL